MHGGVWEPIIFLFHIHEMIKHGPIDYLQKGAARPNKKSSTYFKFFFLFYFFPGLTPVNKICHLMLCHRILVAPRLFSSASLYDQFSCIYKTMIRPFQFYFNSSKLFLRAAVPFNFYHSTVK
jgi:hypothetical protein